MTDNRRRRTENGVQRKEGKRAVMINDANVIQTDIFAKNGVVHLIDKVLIPPM